MTLSDIRKAIMAILDTKYPTYGIYGEEIAQGFIRPSFHVGIEPLDTSFQGRYLKARAILLDISYFSKDQTKAENVEMYDVLEELFGPELPVVDRVLEVQNIRSNVVDKVLHFIFELHFLDAVDVSEEDIPMVDEIIVSEQIN